MTSAPSTAPRLTPGLLSYTWPLDLKVMAMLSFAEVCEVASGQPQALNLLYSF